MVVKLVTVYRVSRKDLGWPVSAAPLQAATKGVKIHYTGSPITYESHSECVSHVNNIRSHHLNHPTENYSDIAYNFLVCQHGYIFEGRGYGRRTGANGNQELNKAHYAVCGLIGSATNIKPSGLMVEAFKEAIRGLRVHGAGKEIIHELH